MSLSQLAIALCDDDPSAVLLMDSLVESTLRLLGLQRDEVRLETFTDPEEAERRAYADRFDLLITDLMWPSRGSSEWPTGLTIAEAAKTANPRTLVVVVTSKTDQEKDFRDAARQRSADLALTWPEAFGVGKMVTAKELARRLAPAIASAVPQIVEVVSANVGLVGLDTVAFSEVDDEMQEAVVRSFLGYMSESLKTVDDPLKRVRPIFVFTGDGVFLGLAGDAGPRMALDVAVTAWQKFTKLARYRTRIAVHSGPVRIATLSTGHQQLLGHSVNWLFRAVNAAPEDGLLVTEEFYANVLQGGRESVPGLQFVRRETEAKHARPLVVRDVAEL